VTVSGVKRVGDDEVCDVNDGAGEVMIETVPLMKPVPGVGAHLGERGSLDEVEGADQIGSAFDAAGLASHA
jgi:hypothetical protein